ncbi:hypothetical protein PtB15_3B308 [Puccinia triticina]|nr:hypothetical protein PtB15_3B308 [Puccinia triticina]
MSHTLKLFYSLTTELVCLYSPDLLHSSSDGGDRTEEDEWEQDPGFKAMLKEYNSDRRRKTTRARRERVMGSLGDPRALKLYSDLLLKASQSYYKRLIQWVANGILYDPYDDFIINASNSITRGTLDDDFTDE